MIEYEGYIRDVNNVKYRIKIINYRLNEPVISGVVDNGSYHNLATVSMSSSDNANIRYTLDGTEPTVLSPLYSSPLQFNQVGTYMLKTRCFLNGYHSQIKEVDFSVYGVSAPVITGASDGGVYYTPVNVYMESAESANIYYTLDGSTPTSSSTLYEGRITFNTDGNKSIKAICIKNGNSSAVTVVNFVIDINIPQPVITGVEEGGVYNSSATVTMTSSFGSIYYTLDGSTPTSSSTLYSSPITVSGVGGKVIKAVTLFNGLYSSVTNVSFVIAGGANQLIYKTIDNDRIENIQSGISTAPWTTTLVSHVYSGGYWFVTVEHDIKALSYYIWNTSSRSRLESMILPYGITELQTSEYGTSVFENCTSLTSIVLPNSITSIGNNMFKNCTSLTSIVLPNNGYIGTEMFYGCTSLTNITIPEGITDVGQYAFWGCNSLTSIISYANLQYIDYFSFGGMSTNTGWKNNGSIYLLGTTFPRFLNDYQFGYIDSRTTGKIYVPSSLEDQYKALHDGYYSSIIVGI